MIEEVHRQERLADQMLSMHSALRDRYARRDKRLTIAITAFSVILCTITFLPDDTLRSLGISTTVFRLLVGSGASFVFFLSLLQLCIHHQARSSQHGEAAIELASLKAQYRDALSGKPVDFEECTQLGQAYETCMRKLPPIPDKLFNALKAYHLRKVGISQMLDASPGCPIWILRLTLMMKGIFEKKTKKDKGGPGR